MCGQFSIGAFILDGRHAAVILDAFRLNAGLHVHRRLRGNSHSHGIDILHMLVRLMANRLMNRLVVDNLFCRLNPGSCTGTTVALSVVLVVVSLVVAVSLSRTMSVRLSASVSRFHSHPRHRKPSPRRLKRPATGSG